MSKSQFADENAPPNANFAPADSSNAFSKSIHSHANNFVKSTTSSVPQPPPCTNSTSGWLQALTNFLSGSAPPPIVDSDLQQQQPQQQQQQPLAPDVATEAVDRKPQAGRRRRSSAGGAKATPLSKKLWMKKERDRLAELDAMIRNCALDIAAYEAQYRVALRGRNIRLADEIAEHLGSVLAQKVELTREKVNIRSRKTRSSFGATGKSSP